MRVDDEDVQGCRSIMINRMCDVSSVCINAVFGGLDRYNKLYVDMFDTKEADCNRSLLQPGGLDHD